MNVFAQSRYKSPNASAIFGSNGGKNRNIEAKQATALLQPLLRLVLVLLQLEHERAGRVVSCCECVEKLHPDATRQGQQRSCLGVLQQGRSSSGSGRGELWGASGRGRAGEEEARHTWTSLGRSRLYRIAVPSVN